MAQTIQKSFPDAWGFGQFMTIGSGWQVMFVTNLNDSGSGSLRAAFESSTPRIIIPRVAGYISLSSRISAQSNFIYLGFLAPGEGLCIRNYELRVWNRENFILRGMKSRRGDQGGEGDCIDVINCQNYIFDRCSTSWGTDETFSNSGGRDMTIQNCLASEGLDDSVHSKGTHGYGGILGLYNYSFHQNLMSTFRQRMPSVSINDHPSRPAPTTEIADIRHNGFYNWRGRCSENGHEQNVNLINNHYQPGPLQPNPGTTQKRIFQMTSSDPTIFGTVHMAGNHNTKYPSLTGAIADQKEMFFFATTALRDEWLDIVVTGTPFAIPAGDFYEHDLTPAQVKALILEKCGYPVRDAIDQRILDDYENDTQTNHLGNPISPPKLIDSQTEVGGWLALDTTSNPHLTGSSPHFLPAWFITKYDLNPALDYISSGNPSAMPHKFIFFEAGVAVNYETLPGGYDWENTIHYHVYEVLSFEITGEIDLIVDKIITPDENNITGDLQIPPITSEATLTNQVPVYEITGHALLPEITSEALMTSGDPANNITGDALIPAITSEAVIEQIVPVYSITAHALLPEITSTASLSTAEDLIWRVPGRGNSRKKNKLK